MGKSRQEAKRLAGRSTWAKLRRFAMSENKTTDTNEPELTPEGGSPEPVEATEGSDSNSGSQAGGADRDTGLLKQLEAATAQAADYKDRLLRQAAELENFRKRSLREKDELRRFATSALIEDLIPALDNLKLGLNSARQHHPEAKAVLDGIDMVVTQLRGILRQHGVEEIEPAAGEAFNPNLHEAAAQIASVDLPEGSIINVQRTGYRLHERLLRPATVIVSKGSETVAGDETNVEEQA